jgi:hypothetical protein
MTLSRASDRTVNSKVAPACAPDAEASLLKLHAWVQRNGWAGYDPYDVEHWYLQLPGRIRDTGFLRGLARLPVRVAARHPCLTRRLLGIEKRVYPKAMGLFMNAYVGMYDYFGRTEYLDLAQQCAQWLVDNVPTGYHGYGWGLPIDWQSRIFIPRGTPCGIVSVICAEGFWRLYLRTGKQQYMDYCRNVCTGFLEDLHLDSVGNGALCFSFTPLDHFHVHNPNLWIASFLMKVGQAVGEPAYLDKAEQAATYALQEQRQDGSLSYWGSDQDRAFHSDHYHSGFEIRALHTLWTLTARERYRSAWERYYHYYQRNFFSEEGVPFRNPNDPRLVDIHGCAEALLCHSRILEEFPPARLLLERSLQWTIANMQSSRGYFIHRLTLHHGKQHRTDIPYIRWGQAWMLHGLTAALLALAKPQGDEKPGSPHEQRSRTQREIPR